MKKLYVKLAVTFAAIVSSTSVMAHPGADHTHHGEPWIIAALLIIAVGTGIYTGLKRRDQLV